MNARAPLVAGNAVIMKPAEQTVAIASALMDILLEDRKPLANNRVGAPPLRHPVKGL